MPLIEEGRLFGVVNVVDALVVLLVLAVVVAGVAFVVQPEPEQTGPKLASTYVTLDLGTQPANIVSEINEGDNYSADSTSQLVLTDVHLTPQGDNVRVIVRAKLNGTASEEGITYVGAPPRLGRSLQITTNRYKVSGKIRDVGDSNTLPRESTTVVLQDTMAPLDAREVTAGDKVRVAGRTVATVKDVAAYATGDPTKRAVFVEAALETYRQQGERQFGGNALRRGQTITLSKEAYTLNGRVQRIGSGLNRERANVLLTNTVDVETAERLTQGDIATVAGHDTAEVKSVTTYATNNPERKRVFVGISLQTLSYGGREWFGAVPIQRGRSLTIDTGQYQLSGTIDRVGALEPRGALARRTVTLRMSEVNKDMAMAINSGMNERADGNTVARITDVDVSPSLIITIGDNGSVHVVDHPINREVMITAELRVRETTSGIRFKGRPLQQGSEVVLDLETVTIKTTVVSVGA